MKLNFIYWYIVFNRKTLKCQSIVPYACTLVAQNFLRWNQLLSTVEYNAIIRGSTMHTPCTPCSEWTPLSPWTKTPVLQLSWQQHSNWHRYVIPWSSMLHAAASQSLSCPHSFEYCVSVFSCVVVIITFVWQTQVGSSSQNLDTILSSQSAHDVFEKQPQQSRPRAMEK